MADDLHVVTVQFHGRKNHETGEHDLGPVGVFKTKDKAKADAHAAEVAQADHVREVKQHVEPKV